MPVSVLILLNIVVTKLLLCVESSLKTWTTLLHSTKSMLSKSTRMEMNDKRTKVCSMLSYFGDHKPARSCVAAAELPKGALVRSVRDWFITNPIIYACVSLG